MYQDQVKFLVNKLDEMGQPVECIDTRHGGPYDRGSADAWYHRGCDPHYYEGPSMQSPKIPEELMTEQQVAEYELGYYDNVDGEGKQW